MPFPLSEEELQKTEKEIGAVLPLSYREAMKKNNGGSVDAWENIWELYPIKDQSSKKLISRTTNHIIKETKAAQEWSLFHENALAIGDNGTGDYLVIFKEGSKFESEVFAWFHEDGALVTVAKEFSELKYA